MLHIHRAERADALVDALRAELAAPPPDPFAPEVVAVPTRGMERWLTQRLSAGLGATPGHGDGICANVGFPSPRRLIGEAVAAACGLDADDDPWLPERAVWPLLEIVDACLEEPWLRLLADHLGAPDDAARRARRFGSLRHVADLFDAYALHRPAMVRAWAAGTDADGAGGALAEGARWQPELWRRLRARIGAPGPAERREHACARLRAEPALAGLPARLSLFGLTRLPAGHLEVLQALAAARDVHVFLLHPSPALWGRIAAAGIAPVVRRGDDRTARLPANRLLASWGHDARELQVVLAAAGGAADRHHPVVARAGTLLGRLQAGVRDDRPPPGVPLRGHADARPPLDPGDRSVQVHACHGRARQVEVVRDAILHELAATPGLEPRDVIVMCPDIETFAPLIQATFGAGEPVDDEDGGAPPEAGARPPDLRVRLADRSLRQTNAVLGLVAELLELADGRFAASQVLGLADREPVRRRFRLEDDDLARVQEWVAASGIRWGLDPSQRAPYKLGALATGTWRAGLDRLLLGVAMTEDEQRLFAHVLPLDDVESGAIDLAGRVAEFVARLRDAVTALSHPQPVAAWAAAIGRAADALTATAARDAWQRAELERILGDVVGEAADGPDTPLALQEVRALLADRLKGRPTRANFRTGHLTVCTLVPMRSVPHRVVCLLGLDDGAFPRRAASDGDDLMLAEPHVGDRDPRTEDRQLLLDALMAAQDTLIVAYTGNDERTNAPKPPAVPVGELLDAVDRTVRVEGGEARERVVVRHPLQPFDPRNFRAGALVPGRAWSFDRGTLAGARALTCARSPAAPFLPGPLAAPAAPFLAVEDLVAFVQHPVRAFLRRRLGISLWERADEVEDALSVELDKLAEWGVGQRLLEARLAGVAPRAAAQAEIARGTLPPGVLGRPVIDAVMPTVEAIVARAEALVPGGREAGSIDVRLTLPDGRLLTGTVPGVSGDVLRTAIYARVGPRHRLAAWVRLLALTAAQPGRPFAAATIGRAPTGDAVSAIRLPALGPDPAARRAAARGHLSTVLDLYDRGMREPLPLFCKSSAAYAAAAAAGAEGEVPARKAWESGHVVRGEDADAEHELALDGRLPFDALLAAAPGAGEDWPGWAAAEATRFGRLACRLWEPVLAAEVAA